MSDALTTRRQRVLVFRPLPLDQLARIEAEHEVTVANPRQPDQSVAFHHALADADALIGASYPIDDALLSKAPHLKVISSVSVGIDNYDQAALLARGITLCNTPGVLTETTADTLFALIMASSRRVVELANHVKAGRWVRNLEEDLFGWDVHGKTLGIVGFGRIGQALAKRAALGFGMPVLYHARRPVSLEQNCPELMGKVIHTSMDDLLRQADIVALVLPLNEHTRGLIGAREFALMKPGAIFINGARGPIVDEEALLDALNAGALRAAGLDVFATEPLPFASPLRNHPKVTALPHAGSATFETRHAMAVMATTNLLLALAGNPPLAPVGMAVSTSSPEAPPVKEQPFA